MIGQTVKKCKGGVGIFKREDCGAMGEPTERAIVNYRLDDQIGFILRQVSQRHAVIFADLMIDGLTPTRFAVLAKLFEHDAMAQNQLGRKTAMDAATIKGVVDRLEARGLVEVRQDPDDGRKRVIGLTEKSRAMMDVIIPLGVEISEKTLEPLDEVERGELLRLLGKMV